MRPHRRSRAALVAAVAALVAAPSALAKLPPLPHGWPKTLQIGLMGNPGAARDAGYYEQVQGNPRTWFTPADFHRHLLYGATFVRLAGVRIAAWQIPLGNTHLDDTPGHYRDNRVEWLLGSRAHLRSYAAAGYVGFLFGGGADGMTSAASDGGFFYAKDRAYYRAGSLPLP